MKHIAINAIYLTKPYQGSGFEVYLKNLLFSLEKKDDCFYHLFIPARFPCSLSLSIKYYNFIPLSFLSNDHSLFAKAIVKSKIFSDLKPEYFFLPHCESIPKPPPYTKLVITVHDVIPTLFLTPSFLFTGKTPLSMITLKGFTDYFIFKKLFKEAHQLLTVSQTSKRNILKLFPFLKKKKINVTYNAPNKSFCPLKKSSCLTLLTNYNLSYKHYLIYFGGHAVRKNVNFMIKAYLSLAKEIRLTHPLVVIDGASRKKKWEEKWGNEVDSILWLEKQQEEDLVKLVSSALIALYPSLYEGFGLPILESLITKTYPLVSDIPTNREILGDNWDYFDPYQEESLTKLLSIKIEQLKKKPFDIENLPKNEVKSIKKRLEMFSWNEAGKTLSNIFQ